MYYSFIAYLHSPGLILTDSKTLEFLNPYKKSNCKTYTAALQSFLVSRSFFKDNFCTHDKKKICPQCTYPVDSDVSVWLIACTKQH